jgi:hypothetical protein
MKYTIAAAFGAIVLGAAIASCGNNGNLATASSTPTPAATPSTPCTAPPNTQVQVVYPQPNATGISTSVGTVIVAVAPNALPATSNLYVSVTDTALQQLLGYAYGTTLQVIPSAQVPPTALTPPFSFPIYEQSTFGGLFGTGDTFRVFLANSTCYPGISLQSAFST